MPTKSLLAGVAAATLVAGSAFAQTSGSMSNGAMGQTTSPNGGGAMQSPSTSAQPYAPPPTMGGPPASSMSDGSMASGGAFTPVRSNPSANIIAVLKASGEFTKLLAALDATNLTGLISTHPNLTLFAPTDTAFAALPPGQLDTLMKSPTQLQALLTYHLVATTIKEGEVKGHAAGQVPTADKSKPVTIDGSGPSIKVDDATVLQSAAAASNGEIYPIDKVLTPPA